ncbi:peroxygenase 3 [Canna indica]|uniref:Peroxygenase 3 n=1 Tax=Canna indica TaxID=4628 RepID=A0AAQ3JLN2_9LILI|nr:peroxygenase 3 [Canna indica]
MKSLVSAAAFLLLLFAAAGSKAQAQTPLQRHAAFFDSNKDGKVYPSETYSKWTVLYSLGKDKNGFLQKETVRKVLNGSLFYEWERARQSSS